MYRSCNPGKSLFTPNQSRKWLTHIGIGPTSADLREHPLTYHASAVSAIAHHDPALRAFLLRRAQKQGHPALIRLDAMRAFVLAAPPFNADGKWREIHGNVREQEHTVEEKIKALGNFKVTLAAK